MKRDGNGRGIFPEEVTKMQNRWKRIGLGLVSLGLVLGLILTAALPTCEAVPDEREVSIGIITAFTGAIATNGVPAGEGQLDYIRYVNEQGGINGTKIKAYWEDYRSLAVRAVDCYNRLRRKGIVLGTCIEDSALMTILPKLIKDKVPFLYIPGACASTQQHRPQWVVGSGPIGENMWIDCALWAKGMWTEERPMRVGMLVADVPIGRAGVPNVALALEELGMKWIGVEFSPIVGMLDFSVELLRLASKGVDCMLLAHYGANGSVVVKDVARLGLMEKRVFVADFAALDESNLAVVGKAADGWYKLCCTPNAFMTEQYRGVKTAVEVAKRYRGREQENIPIHYMNGWRAGLVAVEGLRLAIEEVGVESLTGSAIRDALFRIKDFDPGFGPPITITEEEAYYSSFYYATRIENGRMVCISDWMEDVHFYCYVVTEEGEVRVERVRSSE